MFVVTLILLEDIVDGKETLEGFVFALGTLYPFANPIEVANIAPRFPRFGSVEVPFNLEFEDLTRGFFIEVLGAETFNRSDHKEVIVLDGVSGEVEVIRSSMELPKGFHMVDPETHRDQIQYGVFSIVFRYGHNFKRSFQDGFKFVGLFSYCKVIKVIGKNKGIYGEHGFFVLIGLILCGDVDLISQTDLLSGLGFEGPFG